VKVLRLGSKLIVDLLVLAGAFLISYTIYKVNGFVSESPLSKATILIKIFSMIALVALPFREYFNWTFSNNLKGGDKIVWSMMIAISFAFLFLPLILIIPTALSFFKNNTFFIFMNIVALVILFGSDWVIHSRLKENVKAWEAELDDQIPLVNPNDKDSRPQKALNARILKLSNDIKTSKDSILFYNEILWYADGAIVLALGVTYGLYFTIYQLFSIEMTNLFYQNFFDGATTFQLIISTVIYFSISYKYKVHLPHKNSPSI
jgi:hypothetical protein